VKQVIAIIAKHGLTLASGHVLADEALMIFREAKRQGVQHMIATHAFDLAGKMTLEQMQEAAKLGHSSSSTTEIHSRRAHGRDPQSRTAVQFPFGILDQGQCPQRVRRAEGVGTFARRCGLAASPTGNST